MKRNGVDAQENYVVVPESVLYAPIHPGALKIYMVLRRHADDQGLAYPSRRRLAELSGFSLNTVDNHLKELVAFGLLEIERRIDETDRQTSNLYHLAVQFLGGEGEKVGEDEGEKVGEGEGAKVGEPRTRSPIELKPQELELPNGSVNTAQILSAHPDFASFWATYPRKVGKPKARQKFDQACHRAPPEEIILGAARYRDDPNREDGFTAHPTTWLERDGWNDPPLPARSNGKVGTSTRRLLAWADQLEREGK